MSTTPRTNRAKEMRRIANVALMSAALVAVTSACLPSSLWAAEQEVPKVRQLRCGSCPDGFATTAITNDPVNCKDGDPTLVQCAPLGNALLTVCGECPDGYDKVGSSNNPSQCNKDGGAMSRCQSRNLGTTSGQPQ
ncbi:MAG: hypothetical protein U0172_09435 [Nitrospiraceae bacterium]